MHSLNRISKLNYNNFQIRNLARKVRRPTHLLNLAKKLDLGSGAAGYDMPAAQRKKLGNSLESQGPQELPPMATGLMEARSDDFLEIFTDCLNHRNFSNMLPWCSSPSMFIDFTRVKVNPDFSHVMVYWYSEVIPQLSSQIIQNEKIDQDKKEGNKDNNDNYSYGYNSIQDDEYTEEKLIALHEKDVNDNEIEDGIRITASDLNPSLYNDDNNIDKDDDEIDYEAKWEEVDELQADALNRIQEQRARTKNKYRTRKIAQGIDVDEENDEGLGEDVVMLRNKFRKSFHTYITNCLKKRTPQFRSELNRKVQFKRVPQITFHYDEHVDAFTAAALDRRRGGSKYKSSVPL